MADNVGLRFVGRLAEECPSIVINASNGNIPMLVVDVALKSIELTSSIIGYCGERNRTNEIRNQIKMQTVVLDKQVENTKILCDEQLNDLKKRLYIDFKEEKVKLQNSLDEYKRLMELKINEMNQYNKEDLETIRVVRKMCTEFDKILTKIEYAIKNVNRLEENKSYVYSLQEDFRQVQSKYNNLIKSVA